MVFLSTMSTDPLMESREIKQNSHADDSSARFRSISCHLGQIQFSTKSTFSFSFFFISRYFKVLNITKLLHMFSLLSFARRLSETSVPLALKSRIGVAAVEDY